MRDIEAINTGSFLLGLSCKSKYTKLIIMIAAASESNRVSFSNIIKELSVLEKKDIITQI